MSERAAAITTAASAVWGRSASSELKNSSSTTTRPAPTRPVTWLLAPDCSATAVREPLVDTAKPWKNPAAMLAAPMPIISWSGFDLVTPPGREARGRGDGVGERHERDAHGGEEQGADVAEARPGEGGLGDALRQRTDGGHALVGEPERGRHDGGADDGHQHGRHPACDPGQDEQHGEHGEADRERRQVGLVESLDEGLAPR